jgi:hypothetical protein
MVVNAGEATAKAMFAVHVNGFGAMRQSLVSPCWEDWGVPTVEPATPGAAPERIDIVVPEANPATGCPNVAEIANEADAPAPPPQLMTEVSIVIAAREVGGALARRAMTKMPARWLWRMSPCAIWCENRSKWPDPETSPFLTLYSDRPTNYRKDVAHESALRKPESNEGSRRIMVSRVR